jgi:DNA-3-methyladenine glycosylase II
MSPAYWPQSIAELSARDPVLRALIQRYQSHVLQPRGDAFVTLARSIVGQQLSVSAARSIWQRLNHGVGNISPVVIAGMQSARLRQHGLSQKKADFLIGLAERFIDGSFDQARWQASADEDIIAELSTVKGIGRWTGEMFLIFCLLRPNVLPLDDAGLQRAMRLHYNDGKPLSRLKTQRITRPWQPWCTVATWFMWRSLDPAKNG